MIKSIKVLLCGKNVIYCHFFDKITRIPSGRIVVPSGRIAVPLMGGFLVLEGKILQWLLSGVGTQHPGINSLVLYQLSYAVMVNVS